MYDKICREDFLREAYKRVRANRGSPGVDGISFADVDEGGLESFLREIRKSLMEKSYRPDPVLRVMIRSPTARNDRSGFRQYGIAW
ncbi:MAG: hypothetical protein H7A21_06920 [Spirochaetales bacterium]|nr:hypothetical protein [Spirochaetales bacterium]